MCAGSGARAPRASGRLPEQNRFGQKIFPTTYPSLDLLMYTICVSIYIICQLLGQLSQLPNFVGSPQERKIVMVGLDAAGKTTVLYRLKLNELVMTIPTIGAIVSAQWEWHV